MTAYRSPLAARTIDTAEGDAAERLSVPEGHGHGAERVRRDGELIASSLASMSIPTIIVFGADVEEVAREICLASRHRLGQLVHDADSPAPAFAGQGAA